MENSQPQGRDWKRLAGQFAKFFVVGVINTGVDFLVLNVEMKMTGITSGGAILILNAISFSVATVNSYFLNKFWTFSDKTKAGQTTQFSQFFAVSLVGITINSALVYLITTFVSPFLGIGAILALFPASSVGQLWANFAKLFATGVSLVWNFLGYKLWVFKK